MDITVLIKAIIEIGITPALLIFFVKYFFDRDKNRDKQFDEQYKNFRDRENILIAESTRRDEILRQESEKREKILRTEAEKRESQLMATIAGFSNTMEKISDAMEDIKNSYIQMEYRIGGIETKIERMRADGGQTGDCQSKGA